MASTRDDRDYPSGEGNDATADQVTVNAEALTELIEYANEQARGWASEFTRDPSEEHDPELKAVVARLGVLHPAHEPERKNTAPSAPDHRDYPSGESNDARLMRWLVDHKTDPLIRSEGTEPVTMTGGDLFDLMYDVTEWAYHNGVHDLRERHGIK